MHAYFSPKEAAAYLKLSANTLAAWRSHGYGPSFMKFGNQRRSPIVYRRADLETWLTERKKPKRGRPKGTMTKVSMTKLKAKIHRVMMRHHLTSTDIKLIMSAFGIEKLHEIPVDRYPDFVATVVALGERYNERDSDA